MSPPVALARAPGPRVETRPMPTTCRICGKPIKAGGAKGLCGTHYQRSSRFLKEYEREPTDEELGAPLERRDPVGLALLNFKPQVAPAARATLKTEAERLGVTEYRLVCDVLEGWCLTPEAERERLLRRAKGAKR
jgi:hypothetical protein